MVAPEWQSRFRTLWMTTHCWRSLASRPWHRISPNFTMCARALRSGPRKKVATQRACDDFETFRPLFDQLQRELDAGIRETRPSSESRRSPLAGFFIVGGQKAYVAEMGEVFRPQERLPTITIRLHGRTRSRRPN